VKTQGLSFGREGGGRGGGLFQTLKYGRVNCVNTGRQGGAKPERKMVKNGKDKGLHAE